ncbi:TPA: hypothetical protein ENX78_18260, partial [Candidatus Poribacteria bacterium]|nr:hypothetical protein [Candidatus Poribacteria bacterium]
MRTITKIIFIIFLLGFGFAFAFHADITIDGLFDDWTSVKGYPDDENDTFGGPKDDTMDILS